MASERDTYRGNTIENRGCLFIGILGVDNAKSGICYIYICMYVWMVRMLFKRMLFKRARGERFSPKNTAI